MAEMIPDVDPAELEHSSEAPVYEALRGQLPSDFIVIHSYPWLRPTRGEQGALAEGEADFVVMHPKLGMLVLEVKGGDTIRHDGYRWFRDTHKGPREFRNPFLQARRNMHALLSLALERSGRRIHREDFIHGYAVVFPHMDYEGPPPPDSDKAIVIGRRQIPFMDQAIAAAYAAWTDEERVLAPHRYRMLLQDCLLPRFRLIRQVGPDLSEAADQLLLLTQTQAKVFEGLYVQDRVLVEGVAGSGKTFLALNRALAFARSGRRVLLVCFNRELATWLRRQVADDPTAEECRALLTIQNFHALAADLAARAGLPFQPAAGGLADQAFWDNEVPDILEQAVQELGEPDRQFDALVVDEAQDFCLGWWFALTQSLLRSPDSPIYAFLDPNQSLRGEVQPPPIAFNARFQLTMNCRNTRKIAATSASVLELQPGVFPLAPSGRPPRLLRAGTRSAQKGLVLEEIRTLLGREDVKPRQLALIGPAAKGSGSLSDVDEVAGVPLVSNAESWRDGGGVLVTTARSFKGLEADVVLLYDLGDFGPLFRREDLYVACTRAKALLVAVVHGPDARRALEAALTKAEEQL